MGALRYHPDAASYEIADIVDLFVPHRLWDTIRRARNQLLYGGAGSGKTMLLRRLWWPSMIAAIATEQTYLHWHVHDLL
jgi:hypothetical protein